MRCQACNKRLTEFESTVKYASTGEYVDLCNRCRALSDPSILFIERSDLASGDDSSSGLDETTEETTHEPGEY